MRRRDFLKLVAASGAGSVVFTGCQVTEWAGTWGDGNPSREFKIQSPVMNPEDMQYGRDAYFATVYPQSSGGSGLIIRVFEGRAKKVEGNPDFPLNMGRTSPIDQALVHEVYHPDRLAGPMRLRDGAERGSGDYDAISWDEALSELSTALSEAGGAENSIVLLTGPVSGTNAVLAREFGSAAGARHVQIDLDEKLVLREAMRRVFGSEHLPSIDLANTRFLLNFSAEFLHHWISPTQFNIAYGEFRQGGENPRGTYWHVGPQLSATASNADRWFPINPGTEGMVALAMARVMSDEGLVDSGAVGSIYGDALGSIDVAQVATMSGLSADQIAELARRFAEAGPSVAIAGTHAAAHTNGLFNLSAVFSLNFLVGSVGVPGGLILNPDSPLPDDIPNPTSGISYRDLTTLATDINNGVTQLVLIHGTNPVYSYPDASGLGEALAIAPRVISFSSFLDETSVYADLILPDLTVLENWGVHVPDPGPGYPIVGLQQPVVQPFVDARAFGDLLMQASAQAGISLPWQSNQELVQTTVNALVGQGGNIEADDPREFMVTMQAQGGWWNDGATAAAAPSAPAQPLTPLEPEFAGDAGEYPFYMLPYPHNSLGHGEFAHLPWLQALPEPISTAVWTTWVELNPATADDLDVEIGDIVEVTSPSGSFELPVYVNPAAAPTVALIPMGQGHEHYTRYAEDRGENPFDIVAPQIESETGALAWAATRVRIEKVDRKVRLPRFEGYVTPRQLEEFPIIQVTRPESE